MKAANQFKALELYLNHEDFNIHRKLNPLSKTVYFKGCENAIKVVEVSI